MVRGKQQADPGIELIEAVNGRDVPTVARLLAAGGDANARDEEGVALLMLAADHEESWIAALLLDHGADVAALDPVHEEPALMSAIRAGAEEVVCLLLDRGADVKFRSASDDDNTPLLAALDPNTIEAPSLSVVTLLLQAGAEVNAANCNGWTPLMLASHHKDMEVLDRLIAAGADVRAQRGPGIFAVDVAEAQGNDAFVRRLVEAGGPTPDETGAARMRELWRRIDAWFVANAEGCHENLVKARGASVQRIAKLERAIGRRLPGDLRAHLRMFGGRGKVDFREYDGMTVEQILERWQGLEQLRRDGTFKTAKPHELSKEADEVRFAWWHGGWIPFAEDSGGNLLCVDLDPGPRGRSGQVLGWEIHGGPVGPRAPSFDAFLRDYADQLEAGKHAF